VKPWLVLTAVLLGFFMALLDTTIVNIAIPSIQTDLSADLLSTAVLVWLSLKLSHV
jgi:MFS family permease